MRVRHSHLNRLTIARIMKYKTKREKEEMSIDELMAYGEELKRYSLKWEKIQLFVMGVCLGGTICTVLMYVAHVA